MSNTCRWIFIAGMTIVIFGPGTVCNVSGASVAGLGIGIGFHRSALDMKRTTRNARFWLVAPIVVAALAALAIEGTFFF